MEKLAFNNFAISIADFTLPTATATATAISIIFFL
jgi:hypothetical protein